MIPNDKYRVSKDTSARKTAASPGMVPQLEVNAIKASYEAYINTMKDGHEASIGSLRSEHAEEMAEVRGELEEERSHNLTSQEAAVSEALKKAKAEDTDLLATLRNQISQADKEISGLQASLKEALEKQRTDATTAERRETQLREAHERKMKSASSQTEEMKRSAAMELVNVKRAANSKMTELKAELAVGPNSWLQLRFRCRGHRKERLFYYRYTATLREAATELMKDQSLSSVSLRDLNFRRGGEAGVACNVDQTLQQLEIKDGDEIWFEKKA